MKYADQHPCPECAEPSPRVLSRTNFQFKGVAEGDPTRRGSSGSHDLDYPSLDKAIGRSANRKWKEYDRKFKERARVRRELGTNAMARDADGNVSPVDPKVASLREQGIKTWQKALGQNSD